VLQSAVVCCSTLHSVAAGVHNKGIAREEVAVIVSTGVLRSVAECCRVLQSFAECCRVLRLVNTWRGSHVKRSH